MRIFSLMVMPVAAFDLTWYSDEKCATPTMDVKGKISGKEFKGSSSVQTWTLGRPQECVEFGTEIEVKTDVPNMKAIKYKFGRVEYCSEYGNAAVTMFTADHAQCKYKKNFEAKPADGKLPPVAYEFKGTSMCQHVWKGHNMTSPYPGLTFQDSEKILGSYKINCNPNPADVAAICLGSLAIVFSFVAIGLAVVAKGK